MKTSDLAGFRYGVIALALLQLACSPRSNSQQATIPARPDPHAAEVSQATFRGKWPLTIDTATIRCKPVSDAAEALTLESEGRTWALNGTAKAATGAPLIGDQPPDIWLADPANPGAKVSLGDLMGAARALC